MVVTDFLAITQKHWHQGSVAQDEAGILVDIHKIEVKGEFVLQAFQGGDHFLA